jgi:DNA-binding SARP family transcriptional activator/TolB-like protein
MIHLTVLGGVDLRAGDDQVVGSVLNQPRRLALLTYLAVESGGGGVQRDQLLGVFWPDLSQDQARQSLRSALHFLRRSLGPTAITTQGAAVALDPNEFRCDATEFLSALKSGEAERALRLYQGDVLPGFYLDDGPVEFERWLEERRTAMRREAAGAAWLLAVQEEAAGNAPGAGAWARRAAHLFDGDEAAVRRSMDLMGRIGDRAGALEAHQALAERLREEFGAEPSPATEAALARVRGEAGHPVPGTDAAMGPSDETRSEPVRSGEPGGFVDSSRPEADPPARAPSPRGRLRRLGRTLSSAAVSLVLVVAFYSLWGLERGETAGSSIPGDVVLHVEELRDFSADGSTEDLAGALTLELTGRLSEASTIRVISLAGTPAPAAGPAGRPGSYVVRGGVMRSGELVRVTAMLVDGASGVTLERITTESALDPSATLLTTTEIADDMARRIRREVGRALSELERGTSSRNATALALVRGAVADMAAADSLRRTGAPEAARAALAAADSQLAQAHSAARRWPEPSVQRAEIAYREMWLALLSRGEPDGGVTEVLRGGLRHAATALSAGPNDPAAHELAGLLNYWTWRLRAGGSAVQDEEALVRAEHHLRRATELDGGRTRAWSILSTLLEARGEFGAAKLAAGRAFRADAYLENPTETLLRLFTTSLEVGDMAGARRWCSEISRRDLVAWLPQYCALELMAWTDPAGTAEDSILGLVDAAVRVSPGAAPVHARIRMLGAVVLARAGSPAAAAEMQAARETAPADAALLALEAWAALALGDRAAAAELLEQAAAADARGSQAILKSQRFAALREK